MSDKLDVAGLVKECRAASVRASSADKIVANAKSARNRAAGDEGAEYSWLTPEQTLEGRLATALESLAAKLAERDAELAAMTARAEAAEKDSRRLDWLEKLAGLSESGDMDDLERSDRCGQEIRNAFLTNGLNIRAAIDEAMR